MIIILPDIFYAFKPIFKEFQGFKLFNYNLEHLDHWNWIFLLQFFDLSCACYISICLIKFKAHLI
jgi:hypothetical protein